MLEKHDHYQRLKNKNIVKKDYMERNRASLPNYIEDKGQRLK